MKNYQNHMIALLKVPKSYPNDFTVFRKNAYATLEVDMYFFTQENMLSIKTSALITAKGNHTDQGNLDLTIYSEHPSSCHTDYAELKIARMDEIFEEIIQKKEAYSNSIVLKVSTIFEESISDFIENTNKLFNKNIEILFKKELILKKDLTEHQIKFNIKNGTLDKLKKTFLRSFNKAKRFSNNSINDKYRFHFGDGSLEIMKYISKHSEKALLKSTLDKTLRNNEIKIVNTLKI